MKKTILVLFTLLSFGCVINKSVHIDIINSSNVEIDPKISGSDVEDIKPSLEIPLIP